jgi:hypothetical protein
MSVFHWVFLATYLPRFSTIHDLDFVGADKAKRGSAIQVFNTFCERLGGTVRDSSFLTPAWFRGLLREKWSLCWCP